MKEESIKEATDSLHEWPAERVRMIKLKLEELKKQNLLERDPKQFWQEFRNLSKELSDALEYGEKARKLMRESPLPEFLYHATTAQKKDVILQESLRAGFSKREEDKNGIYLSESIAYALHCATQTQEAHPKELIVFRVKTGGLPREQFLSMLPFKNPLVPTEPIHEVVYGGMVVPSENLEPLSQAEIYTLLQEEISRLEQNQESKQTKIEP